MIGVIDYGMGNLFSVSKALERLEAPYILSSKESELEKTDGLILPGVGAFKDAMKRLRETGLASFLQDYTKTGRPLLGICLGMQLLFEESEENGLEEGLGLLKGRVARIPSDNGKETFKIPHMGWNRLSFHQASPITESVEEGFVYFVHSYYASSIEENTLIASADYSVQIPAIVAKGNIYGMQFHPEKSGKTGMGLLKNFTEMMERSGAEQ
ncbi:imidazole glycerol phosphate synthase subunit HisH [Bacillus smithii]|uniref:imidazole glycerol phosphate synthase subunit HisH n=1 Tax=Bacillus smithii TaxID=1479 RepID=UPI002E1B089F|nr:imidazole glycerol phosphate synthase subunit HisH [Bacillus smithii]